MTMLKNVFNKMILLDLDLLLIYLLVCLIGGFGVLGIWLASNHSWEETAVTFKHGTLIDNPTMKVRRYAVLWNLRKYIRVSAYMLDRSLIGMGLLNLINALALGAPAIVAISLGYYYQDWSYVWLLSYYVLSLVLVGKDFFTLSDILLGCYRCMPTFWVGLPFVLYYTVCGCIADVNYFAYILLTPAIVGAASTVSTLGYMLYAYLKTKIDVNKKDKILCECLIEKYKK